MAVSDWGSYWANFFSSAKIFQTTIGVPASSATLEAIVAEHQDRTRALDVTFTLVSPSGTTYSSSPTSTSPGMRVVRHNGYLFARVTAPAAGNWIMKVSAPAGSNAFRGEFQAFAKNTASNGELWTRRVSGNTYALEFNARYQSSLAKLGAVQFMLRSSAGTTLVVPAIVSAESPYVYEAAVTLPSQTILWQVQATAQTTISTYNDPGEGLFSAAQVLSIPNLQFSEQTAIQGRKQ